MALNNFMAVMRPRIENELKRSVLRSLPADAPELSAMIQYHMGWEGEGAGIEAQGKRIRPLLVLLCAASAGGNWVNALPAAVAVELLHNFSLVHDDIQDQSPYRRSRLTVWKKWGIAQAINAGDVLFTLAFCALHSLRESVSSEAVLATNQVLLDACIRLTQGQYLDLAYEQKLELPLSDYWPMIGGKTAALLGACCEMGAITAGAANIRRVSFRNYGISLGMAFQVLDDWLGIWGDAALTGKSTESDLVSGKKSLPVVFALEKAGQFADRWKKGSIQPDEVSYLAHLLEQEGASDYCQETANKLTAQALENLHEAVIDSEAGEALRELTLQLLHRQK